MNRSILYGIVALLVVVLLAGGAYAGVRLFAQSEDVAVFVEKDSNESVVERDGDNSNGSGQSTGRVIQSIAIENDGAPVAIQTTILPAPELPDEPSTAFGSFSTNTATSSD